MMVSFFNFKSSDEKSNIDLPTFNPKPISNTSSLLQRKTEEERFLKSGAKKEKMFEFL